MTANKVLLDKNIIHHINVVTKPPRILTLYFPSRKNRIGKLYICIVLDNIRNIYV